MMVATKMPVDHPRHGPFAALRSDGYALLGALLRQPPTPEIIRLIAGMRWPEGLSVDLADALAALSAGAARTGPEEMEEEYFKLFIGLGRGILVPYASWYQEKMIQSGPLAAIRRDLALLGMVRQDASWESEDHAGAVCEAMALLSASAEAEAEPVNEEAVFFRRHLDWWMVRFFDDLAAMGDCSFYRRAGEFGRRFLQAEKAYLKEFYPALFDLEEIDLHPGGATCPPTLLSPLS